MSLFERINTDFIAAMKQRKEQELSTLRLLRTALKNRQIELMRELTEADAHAVIKTQMKQLKEGLESFEQAGRSEMASAARKELVILERYLPAQMSDEELTKIVKEAVAASGASSPSDTGKAMGTVMKAVAGRADGNRVRELVSKILAGTAVWTLFAVSSVEAATTVGKKSVPWTKALVASPWFENSLRAARIIAVVLLILCVHQIMFGAFKYMTAGGSEGQLALGRNQILRGAVLAFVLLLVFLLATTLLIRLG